MSALAAAMTGRAAEPFRYAICNETFVGMRLADACRAARRTGYDGIEIEPAQLSPDPAALTQSERRAFRWTMEDQAIAYCGLHSLLKAPEGLHLTTTNAAVRRKSWDYFKRLVDLAADLGTRPVMVLGSSRQRRAVDGVSPAEATQRLIEGLKEVAPAAEARQVTILLEPLAPHLCNVVTTLGEAMACVREIRSPAVQTMFDTHNIAGEKKKSRELIQEYFPHIRHVHLNEMDGRRPGAGNFPFRDVLQTLKDLGYKGWLSVEVFDFEPDGETVAREAREHLRGVEAKLR